MNTTKETQKLVIAAMLLTMAVIIQILGKSIPQISQFIVGPTVNAILLLTLYFSGLKWALLVGISTPVLAFVTGVLATPMGPFIPFIAIGNGLYILLFSLLMNRRNGETIGVIIASLAKFLFLYFSATQIINIFALGIPEPVKKSLAIAMGIPQFITALVGGFAAMFLHILLRKRLKNTRQDQ